MHSKYRWDKYTKSYTIGSFYNYYLDLIEPDSRYDISYSTYRDILLDLFEYIADEVINKSKTVKLPGRFGKLMVIKSKPNYSKKHYGLGVDFKKTKEEGKTVYYTNIPTSGYKVRFYWKKDEILVPHKSWYKLVMVRARKRQLASAFKGGVDYEELAR